MESERSLKIVVGYQPQFDSPLSDVKEAGLTAMVATVLSTYRSNNPDMFCDHRLWLACTRAVTEVVEADQTLVFAEDPPRVLKRLFSRRIGPAIGSLESYESQITNNPDTGDWALLHWCRRGLLVAAAVNEPWYRVGGPDLYHDSYTTCFFVAPSSVLRLIEVIRTRAEEEGGYIEDVLSQ